MRRGADHDKTADTAVTDDTLTAGTPSASAGKVSYNTTADVALPADVDATSWKRYDLSGAATATLTSVPCPSYIRQVG